MIPGVASGLADYFDVDPTLVRLVFIIAALINGIGIFVYIVMSFVVPVHENRAEHRSHWKGECRHE